MQFLHFSVNNSSYDNKEQYYIQLVTEKEYYHIFLYLRPRDKNFCIFLCTKKCFF